MKILFIIFTFLFSSSLFSCVDIQEQNSGTIKGKQRNSLMVHTILKTGLISLTESVYKDLLVALTDEEYDILKDYVFPLQKKGGETKYLIEAPDLDLIFIVQFTESSDYPIVRIMSRYLNSGKDFIPVPNWKNWWHEPSFVNNLKTSCSSSKYSPGHKLNLRGILERMFCTDEFDFLDSDILANNFNVDKSDRYPLDFPAESLEKIISLKIFSDSGAVYESEPDQFVTPHFSLVPPTYTAGRTESIGQGLFLTMSLKGKSTQKQPGFTINSRVLRIILGFLGAQPDITQNEYDNVKEKLLKFLEDQSGKSISIMESCMPVRPISFSHSTPLSTKIYPITSKFVLERKGVELPFLETPACISK